MFHNTFSNYFYPRMPMYPMNSGIPYKPIPKPMPTPMPMPTPTPPEPSAPDFEIEPGAPVQTDINYTQGYLQTQIGRYVKIEFLIGTNMLIDREGVLKEVGISYVIIQEPETDDLLLCDVYSIKFIRFYY